ncbi:MAG TPA: BACON domain-containing protein, partial [Bryobacteraceae bacterium]|nr:BACON domain-containing protein [Bryobacteraceae bacterium]
PTQLLATVNGALITAPGSAAVTVVSAHGASAPSPLDIAPSLGASFDSQRVTTTAPPLSGCGAIPPATNFFSITDIVFLYFNASITASNALTYDWLAPNGGVVAGGTWPPTESTVCPSNAGSLVLGNLGFSNVAGIWQARVFDKGSLLFSIPFGVNTLIVSPFPAGGEILSATGGSQSVNLTLPANYSWTASSSVNWITLAGASAGVGSTVLSYQVAANAGAARSGTITIAGFSFTLEQQAASILGLNFIGSMPHLAAEENWTTRFTLVNKGSALTQARLSLFGDPSGELTLPMAFPQQPAAPNPLLAASLDQALAANASLVIDTAGQQTPPVQVGSTQLAATGAVDGFAIFHLIPGAQEAVVPLETRNASSYLLAFDNTGGVVLGVAVENVSAQAASIGVVIRDDTGSQLAAGPLPTLAGGGHTSFVLSTLFPVTANQRGTIQFNTPPGGRISVLGIRTTPLGTNKTLTTIPALANIGTSGGSIAHIAVSNGWQTTFVLVNAGATRSSATLKFFDDGGNPLRLSVSYPQLGGNATTGSSVNPSVGAGAMLMIVANGPLADPVQIGSAQLTTSGDISGFVIFRYNPNGQEAVVPLENRKANAYVLAFDNTNRTATGVAINNISAQAVNIPVIVRDDTGAQIAIDTIPLAANGHLAFTLATDKYPAAANIRGTVEFVAPAGAQIGALGIRIPVAHTFTTLPALAK